MQLDLTEDQINHIVYALSELANRRQEQALDYRYNTIAKQANLDDAKAIRSLLTHIRSQSHDKQNR